MKVRINTQAYNQYGGAPSVSPVGDYLSLYLKDLPPRELTIEATACFATDGPPTKTLEDLYEEFHRSLALLPATRFVAKRGVLYLRYHSHVCSAERGLRFGPASLDVFLPALHELAALLPVVLRRKRAAAPALDSNALSVVLATAIADVPSTEEAFRTYVAEAKARAVAAAAALSPWERLDIDWSEYHPEARTLLNDPFFWEEADDNAPHGNDTGADLLHDFRRWRRTHRDKPVSLFLPVLLARWGFEERVLAWAQKPLRDWTQDDALTISVMTGQRSRSHSRRSNSKGAVIRMSATRPWPRSPVKKRPQSQNISVGPFRASAPRDSR
ncbi:MAG: hypothetical protein IPP07_21685 [Holophagales bacterium]|nr:hypothetical protein [Holophagales bacterium]